MIKYIPTSKSWIFLVWLLLAVACNSPSEDPATVNREPDQKATIEEGEAAPPDKKKITSENARAFLKKYARKHPEDEVLISTSFGDIRIRLYKNTPLHRANFLYLTRQGYFDGTWFYRVSEGHVIQAGNTDSQQTINSRNAIGDFLVPSEIVANNYHKSGAVAAARSYSSNPQKNSDPFEFYIVLGNAYSRAELKLLAEKHDLDLSQEQLEFYNNRPGAPHLDGQHTVFGEVISGMDVVEEISRVRVDEGEWPLHNIPIEVQVLE